MEIEKMTNMKKIAVSLLIAMVSLTSCYEDYIKDYDYSAAYIAYQYDLRSFVVGEGMNFDVGVVLGGVIENTRDRYVYLDFDQDLISQNLSPYWPGAPKFKAIDVFKGDAAYGDVSQTYASDAVKAAGISDFTPLPDNCIDIAYKGKLKIAKGKHTATVRVQADSAAVIALANMSNKPYYAIGFRIASADVDTVLLGKSYQVVAVRLENELFGYWYHGGESKIKDASGKESTVRYPTTIPADENSQAVYKLSTTSAYTVAGKYLGKDNGNLVISCKAGTIGVSSPDGASDVKDLGCSTNGAKLLQDRKLFLNYSYVNADGNTVTVKDTLSFRNRIRDGVNEWQDENESHYE